MRPAVHIALHILVPGLVARLAFTERWRFAWVLMVATMLVDLDHLWTDPVFDPNRCSLGFHPLHSEIAIGVYALMSLIRLFRVVGVGLLLHMFLDGLDCAWMRWS